jgi:chromosome segregation ATPase
VIETVMIFALGFLAAALCALLLLPAVNARALRLSQRRIEARLPFSVAEVAAEKDHLRAEFAVARRRLERRVEATQAARHADLAAIGARTLEAAALSRRVEAGTTILQAREAEIAETRTALASVESDLAAARADGAVGRATLQVLEDAHRDLLDDLVRQHHAAPAPDATGIDLTARCAALAAERETLRASLAAAEEALAQAVARTAPQDNDTAALRLRITEVADSLLRRDRLPAVAAYPLARS